MTDKYTLQDLAETINQDIAMFYKEEILRVVNQAYEEGLNVAHKYDLLLKEKNEWKDAHSYVSKKVIKLREENESLKKTIFDLKVKNATILNREQKSLTEKAKAWCNLNYQNLKEYDIVNLKLGAYQEHLEQENEKLKERIDCWNKSDSLRNEVETITNQLINLLDEYPHQSPEAPE